MSSGFHFGSILKKILLEYKYTRLHLAKAMKVSPAILYKYEERFSVQLYIIIKLCHAMKYNILLDVAHTLPQDYEYDQAAKNKFEQQLIDLKEENKKLKWENDLLKELIIKKG